MAAAADTPSIALFISSSFSDPQWPRCRHQYSVALSCGNRLSEGQAAGLAFARTEGCSLAGIADETKCLDLSLCPVSE